jgi:hypothetical protein
MRHVLLLALGIVLSKSHATAQAVDGCALSPEQLASIDTARQARADALVRGDPVAAADVAPDDGVILPAGGPVQQGRAALLAFPHPHPARTLEDGRDQAS